MRRGTSRLQEIDRYVGQRLRERRLMTGLTQHQLADLLGVTYQQLHKYERGINRISAGRLWEMGRVLNCPIAFFYEEIAQGDEPAADGSPRDRLQLELARNFARIQDENVQQSMSDMVRAVAQAVRSDPKR